MDQAAELDQLRRLAYSRSGTEDDRRRLAQLESSMRDAPSPPPPIVSSQEVVEEADTGAPEEPVIEHAPVVRSRWLAAALGAAVGAALATATTLALVALNAPTPEPAPVGSSLTVFDREPLPVDDPSNLSFAVEHVVVGSDGSMPADLDDVTVRWVGVASGNDVYAARWLEGDEATICLISVSAEGGGSACTPQPDFVNNGLWMAAFDVELQWGPTGTEVSVSSLR